MDLQQTTELLQMSLVLRAFFFFVVFCFAGWLTLKSNRENLISVRLLGIILIGIGLFNVFMMYEWIHLFYL